MNQIKCSVVLMSRKRPVFLKTCISSAYENAKYKDDVEFLIRIDDDDIGTQKLFLTDDYFKKIKNLKVFVDKRVGYDYLWFIFKELFKRARGDIIVPLSDDLWINLKDWDENFYQYKDKSIVVGWRGRVILSKKVIEEHPFIARWTGATPHGDSDIWIYSLCRKIFKKIPKWNRKKNPKDRVKKEGIGQAWKLQDKNILNNLTWKLLK